MEEYDSYVWLQEEELEESVFKRVRDHRRNSLTSITNSTANATYPPPSSSDVSFLCCRCS